MTEDPIESVASSVIYEEEKMTFDTHPTWANDQAVEVDFPRCNIGKFKNRQFARKAFKLAPSEKGFAHGRDNFMRELKVLGRAQHQHVVTLVFAYIVKPNRVTADADDPKVDSDDLTNDFGYDNSILDPYAAIIMDRASNLEVALLYTRKSIRQWFHCLAGAIAYIHGIGIRHRDIKPENILVKDNNILLADFGISKVALGRTLSTTTPGQYRDTTLDYCAPEVRDGSSRSRAADIFSLGAVFLYMLAFLRSRGRCELNEVFEYQGFSANLEKIHELLEQWKQSGPRSYDANILCLCSRMLDEDHCKRPDAAEIVDQISTQNLENGCQCTAVANMPQSSQLLYLCRRGLTKDLEQFEDLERLKDAPGAIHQAAAYGQLETLKFLQGRGFDISLEDYSGQTTLHCAASYGRQEIVDYLLDHKYDVAHADSDGRTALHYAAGHGQLEIVKKLMESLGAKIEARDDDGRTALHFAATRGHDEVMQVLLKSHRKQFLDVVDDGNRTALHLAAGYGAESAVKLLLNYNAKTDVWTTHGKEETALGYALKGTRKEARYEAVIKLLLEKMEFNVWHKEVCNGDCKCKPGDRRRPVCEKYVRHSSVLKTLLSYVGDLGGRCDIL